MNLQFNLKELIMPKLKIGDKCLIKLDPKLTKHGSLKDDESCEVIFVSRSIVRVKTENGRVGTLYPWELEYQGAITAFNRS